MAKCSGKKSGAQKNVTAVEKSEAMARPGLTDSSGSWNIGDSSRTLGAHSTRGAAVQFYKKLRVSTEAVCQIGQWKICKLFTNIF